MARGRGNPIGGNKGDYEKSLSERRKSTKGYYYVAFMEPFERLTDRDIELRREYAKDAISRYYGIHKNFVSLRKKSDNNTGINLDEVYYVSVGQQPVGKVSIRITRFSDENNYMTLIYQNKRTTPKKEVKQKFRKIQTETEARRQKKKQQRTNRKGKNKKTR